MNSSASAPRRRRRDRAGGIRRAGPPVNDGPVGALVRSQRWSRSMAKKRPGRPCDSAGLASLLERGQETVCGARRRVATVGEAWTRSAVAGTPTRCARSTMATMCSSTACTPPVRTRPIRCRRPPRSRPAAGRHESGVRRRRIRPLSTRLIRGRSWCTDSGAEVEVPDLAVAHLAGRQPDRLTRMPPAGTAGTRRRAGSSSTSRRPAARCAAGRH